MNVRDVGVKRRRKEVKTGEVYEEPKFCVKL